MGGRPKARRTASFSLPRLTSHFAPPNFMISSSSGSARPPAINRDALSRNGIEVDSTNKR
jgi:hypothetical protein